MSGETKMFLDRVFQHVFEKLQENCNATGPVDCGRALAYSEMQNYLLTIYNEEENNG